MHFGFSLTLFARCKLRIALTLIVFLISSASAVADITDKNLAQCLSSLASKKGWTTPQEFKEVVCHNKGIVSLDGLGTYSNIEKLSLHKNNIDTFDPAPFQSLKILNLGRNALTSLTLNQLPLLSEFYIFDNRLKSLSLKKLPSLKKFKANSNVIETFFYSDVPALAKVYLFDNKMEHIDIYSLPSMKYMDVRQNPMPDKLYENMDKMKGVTILHDGNADDWN